MMNFSNSKPPDLTPRQLRSFFPKRISAWLPWAVLILSLSVTGLVWHQAQKQAARQIQAEFDFSVREVAQDIELRMENYQLLLHGMQGLFSSSAHVSQEEFHTYAEALKLKTRYPGLLRVGFVRIVSEPDRTGHMAAMRAKGHPEYAIRPKSGDPLTTANVFIEPTIDPRSPAIGYDLYADPIRRAAMDRARATGKPALSAKIMPNQPPDQDASAQVFLFLPIHGYRQAPEGTPLAKNIAPPRNIGWVYAQFRADDLMALVSTGHKEKIRFAIYDGADISAATFLSGMRDAGNPADGKASRLGATRQLAIAGQVWTLAAHSSPENDGRLGRPDFILIAGVGISLLLTFLIHTLSHSRTRAIDYANVMNRELIESEYRWKFALEGAGESVWDWDIPTGHLFTSPRLKETILGYAENEYPDTFEAWQQRLHPDDRQRVMDAMNDYLEGKTGEYIVEERLRAKDGSWKWILMRGMVVNRDPAGKPLRMLGTHLDITERHQQEKSLRLSSTVYNAMSEAVVITDGNGIILSVNPSFTKITGYAPEEVIGREPWLLSDGVEDPEKLGALRQSVTSAGSYVGEILQRRKTGEVYLAWVSINSMRTPQGDITNRVSVFSDISERKANEERMQYLAHFDPLTDLPNRALFNDRLRQALAACRRHQTRLAVLFVDLDKFKPVNDTLGHSVGDLLLKEVAFRLLDNIRESDSAARLGGDEFVVLLSTIDTESDAGRVAEKICAAMQDPYLLDGHTIRIAASIGIAVFPNHGQTNQELIAHADEAMYLAKHAGGAAVASYEQIRNPA